MFNIGLYIRLVRAEVLEIADLDYIHFARARGIAEDEIAWRHVLPNSLGPMINVTALAVGSMLAFSLVTETIFQWPGLGLMFIQAIGFSDFPVMAAYFLMVSIIFIVVNLIADVLLGIVDPRIRRASQ
ncbi:hypothetical protein GCM10007928_38350 [Sulfitobacter porphyrae]|nr:hypothetical protein GCM10007928_38350 [Sulfitobacter porphyrae]